VMDDEGANISDERYFDYLRELLFSREFDTLRSIIENDESVLSVKDCDGYTLFDLALDYREIESIEFLLKAGADANWKQIGTPVLVSAIQEGEVRVAEMLLDCGADPNLIDECTGWTPLDWAYQCKNADMVEIIRKSGGVRSVDAE